MRGFGFTFYCGTGRSWYCGEDGIRRWADNDKPVDTPTPEAPEPLDDNPAPIPDAINHEEMK